MPVKCLLKLPENQKKFCGEIENGFKISHLKYYSNTKLKQ